MNTKVVQVGLGILALIGVVIAVTVGSISLATHNLTLALIAGLIVERVVALERINRTILTIQDKLINQFGWIISAQEKAKVDHD